VYSVRFAKLNGSQFTVLDSEFAKPMGKVSGFWLVWNFFGYSHAYGTIVALLQVLGGLLLVWPRTALLAALLLVPVFTNIVMIDLFFGVEPSATLTAAQILGCLVSVILPHLRRLLDAIEIEDVPRHRTPRLLTMALTLVAAYGLSWWIANRNNRAPTAIDGVWIAVADSTPATRSAGPPWARAFFERNRAHLVVFGRQMA
jgi:hypothetical protein